ncbi:MAG: hypothetical protein V4757_10345 [Pseudomonadota bacterium]
MYLEESFEKHRLPPGCSLTLMLHAGDELYCRQGRAAITPTAPLPGDGLLAPVHVLATGQAWRSAGRQWVAIRNCDAQAACTVMQVAPVPVPGHPEENSLADFAARLFQEAVQWIRRGPIAASVKTP